MIQAEWKQASAVASCLVRSIVSASNGPGSSPDRGHINVVFLSKTLTLAMPLSTQMYK